MTHDEWLEKAMRFADEMCFYGKCTAKHDAARAALLANLAAHPVQARNVMEQALNDPPEVIAAEFDRMVRRAANAHPPALAGEQNNPDREAVVPSGYVLSDEQIIERCASVGILWLKPDEDPDGFPGSFDMVTMSEMRAVLAAAPAPATRQQTDEPLVDLILRLHREGMTHDQIAAELDWLERSSEADAAGICIDVVIDEASPPPTQTDCRYPRCACVVKMDGSWT